MLTGIAAGLDKADKLSVGTTAIDLSAYFQHVTGASRAGLAAEVSRRFSRSLSGYASVSGGALRTNGMTSLEALAMLGFRGTF